MTRTNTQKISRAAGMVGGLALTLAGFAPGAAAQSVTTPTVNSVTPFVRDLMVGSSGSDVQALQAWLMARGFAIPAGPTNYFGAQTRAAVAAFQAANGIAPAAGYFGPVTRAQVNTMLGSTTGAPGQSDSDQSGDSSGLRGGEASLERLRARDGEDDSVKEGSSAEVAEFEWRVRNGDARINRIDLTFSPANGNGEDEPWRAFETVRLYADGKEIASEDVSDERDWLDDDAPFVFRFTNLNYVVREGRRANVVVEVEARNGVLDTGATDTWTLYIDANGIRAVDGAGIQQYLGSASQDVSFDLVERGEGEELNVRTSSDDPAATVLKVEENRRSGWHTIFAFDLEAKEGDIEIDTLPIDFTTGAAEVRDVIDDVRLVIDGKTFNDYDWNGSGAFASTTFDIDGDAVIDADDRVEVEVEVRLKAGNGVNYLLGESIRASVRGADIKAEGADDLIGSGSATGEVHALQVSGISVARADRSAVATSVNGDDNDYATFVLRVNVTAFDQDVYIPTTGSDAFTYRIENASDGSTLAQSSATTSIVSSNAQARDGFYRVNEGQTREFIFTVTLDPLAADEGQSYRLQLLTIPFADSPTAPNQVWNAAPVSAYQTPPVFVAD